MWRFISNLYSRFQKHSLDSKVLEIAEDLLEKLPQAIKPLLLPIHPMSSVPSTSDEDTFTSYLSICPLWVFLHNEVLEMNLKISTLRTSLSELVRALKSGALSEVTSLHGSLSRNKVPHQWKVCVVVAGSETEHAH